MPPSAGVLDWICWRTIDCIVLTRGGQSMALCIIASDLPLTSASEKPVSLSSALLTSSITHGSLAEHTAAASLHPRCDACAHRVISGPPKSSPSGIAVSTSSVGESPLSSLSRPEDVLLPLLLPPLPLLLPLSRSDQPLLSGHPHPLPTLRAHSSRLHHRRHPDISLTKTDDRTCSLRRSTSATLSRSVSAPSCSHDQCHLDTRPLSLSCHSSPVLISSIVSPLGYTTTSLNPSSDTSTIGLMMAFAAGRRVDAPPPNPLPTLSIGVAAI
mmetsp:Transcript_41562/g.81206  ORF Transcript_41562/g.81206 Transcript_41562/m.81206 type:complete len:270 (-) Transcript_41562:4606-5415(-)